jgi:hypothetical protein
MQLDPVRRTADLPVDLVEEDHPRHPQVLDVPSHSGEETTPCGLHLPRIRRSRRAPTCGKLRNHQMAAAAGVEEVVTLLMELVRGKLLDPEAVARAVANTEAARRARASSSADADEVTKLTARQRELER